MKFLKEYLKVKMIIQNSNEYTMFQALYMGHDTGDDAKEAYTEEATLTVGAKTKVRDGIYVNQNAKAEIYVTGAEYSNLSSVAFYGNENTKLQIASRTLVYKKLSLLVIFHLIIIENRKIFSKA